MKTQSKIVTLRSIQEGLWDAICDHKDGKLSADDFTRKVWSLERDLSNYGAIKGILSDFVWIPCDPQLEDCVRVNPDLETARKLDAEI